MKGAIKSGRLVSNEFAHNQGDIEMVLCFKNTATSQRKVTVLGKANAESAGGTNGKAWRDFLYNAFSELKSAKWKYADADGCFVEYSDENMEKALAWGAGKTVEQYRATKTEYKM